MKILYLSLFCFASCSNPAMNSKNRLNKIHPETYFSNKLEIELLKAVDRNDLQKIDDLISQGVDLNAIGNTDMTPLAWAIGKQNLAGYRHLLEKGANPNYRTRSVPKNDDGHSVMEFATTAENSEYLVLALKHGGNPNAHVTAVNQTILFTAIKNRRTENIKILAHAGADLNHKYKAGFTPLMECVSQDEFGLALLLLGLGADPTVKSLQGEHVGDFVKQFGDRGIKILNKEKSQRVHYEEFVKELQKRKLM